MQKSKLPVGGLTSYAINALVGLPGLFLSVVPTCEDNPICLTVQFSPDVENGAIQGREVWKVTSQIGRRHINRELI